MLQISEILYLIRDLFRQPFFICVLAIITCVCFYLIKDDRKTFRKLVRVIYFTIFFISIVAFIGSAVYRAYHPKIWDFTSIYICGKVAANGYNFYHPESFQIVFNSLNLPFTDYEGIVEEVVNVGFHFPPPTMLYYFPLGFLSFNTALIVWTIFILFFAFGCVWLIYRLFFNAYRLNGLLLVSTLFFSFFPTLITINFSQTNFILLFYLLLMKKYEDKKVSGIFLALAFFTKPYFLIFILFFILRKKWGTILYFIVASIMLSALAMLLFGTGPFNSYIFDNSIGRLPVNVYLESINQSLHSVLLRYKVITFGDTKQYIYIMGGILLCSGIYLLFLLKKRMYDFIWATLLLVGLIIYPGTLSHYGVLLLFITFQFFDEKKQLGFQLYINIFLIAIFYFLSTFSIFASMCFLLVIIVLKSLNFVQLFTTPRIESQ